MTTLYTIGHSNHSIERFLALLHEHGIDAVADVRSQPYSRYCPHFNRPTLEPVLKNTADIDYDYLGKELGARPEDPTCYVDGRVSYERLAARPAFAKGLERVRKRLTEHHLALLCAEEDPITCHRMILITRRLRAPGLAIQHIRADEMLEKNEKAEERLANALNIRLDLFTGPAEAMEGADNRQLMLPAIADDPEGRAKAIDRAYDLQAERIAYRGGSFDEEREAGPPHG